MLADSLIDSATPADNALPETVGIYRLACVWLFSTASTPLPLADLLEAADKEGLLKAAGDQQTLDAVRTILVRTAFDDALRSHQQLLADAELLRTFIRSARRTFDVKHAVATVWWRRAVRLAMLVPALALTFGVVTANWKSLAQYLPKAPNRLDGVVWQASSSYPKCDLTRRLCEGKPTAIFFHTIEEHSPWVEFDLGRAKSISEVEVKNVNEVHLQARAVPLLVEASRDRSSWTQLAQRDTSFATWTAQFPPTVARYVRLRVPRPTYFHLENVSIR